MNRIKNIIIFFIILSSYFLISCNNDTVINYVVDDTVNSIPLKENKITINDIPKKKTLNISEYIMIINLLMNIKVKN